MPSNPRRPHPARNVLLAALGCLLAAASASRAAPVEFAFRVAPDGDNPFAREIWAEVATPDGQTIRLPAFYAGDDRYAVRARAQHAGNYRLGPITEVAAGATRPLEHAAADPAEVQVAAPSGTPAVGLWTGDPTRFAREDGTPFVPLGANLVESMPHARLPEALAAFAHEGLTWARVWMAHWNDLNLDWNDRDDTPSPRPGWLDLRVAENWDRVIAAAESSGVHLQVVLQHHGQYSTRVNSNWDLNPWNAAQPHGFLGTPGDFFSTPRAIELTKQKYRYIVARWGHSPAIFAWELFNEVHWTDPINLGHDEAPVARWHTLMAEFIRSVDVHRHLVTTSTEELTSPIYAAMDFAQPHHYSSHVLAGIRHYAVAPADLGRPVFYGEFGHDHMPFSADQKRAGVVNIAPVWASLMSEARLPAQPWMGAQILNTGRLGELGAIARFLAATGLATRPGLEPFSASVDSKTRVPLVLVPCQVWQRQAPPVLSLPLDGREPAALAAVPRILVGAPGSIAEGFPNRMTLQADYPRPAHLTLRLAGAAPKGASVAVRVDGRVVARHVWPPSEAGTGGAIDLPFAVARGPRTIVIENPRGEDWFEISGLDLGLETSVLAAVGVRSADFLACWLWHRSGVFSIDPPPPVPGLLRLAGVPPGPWRVTWWDTATGTPAETVAVDHPGGDLALPSPPVARHAAVVLER